MAYTTYTTQMLANYTGRPLASFPEPYTTNSALPQATLLFKIGTCIADPSGLSTDELQMVDWAILSMADAIQLASRYKAVQANPFNSESIGSYSYSKAVKAVQRREETGIEWFDIAVDQLSQCDASDGLAMTGGIQVFEHQGVFAPGDIGANVQFLTPGDIEQSRVWGYDPAQGNYYVPQIGS
jgi:hypothetical protein